MNDRDASAVQAISRREAIRRAALLSGIVLAPSWLAFVDRPAVRAQVSYLTAGQLALLTAVADRILPRTDTPGALDVGVPAFIDRLYGECLAADEQQRLTRGLDAVASASQASAGAPFVALPPARQDEVLRAMAERGDREAQASFQLLRAVTVLGYFTSETVGRNVLHYDPVPGRYDACVPISELGNRNWTT